MKMEMVKIDRYVRARIRMCIWKQWKTPQKKMNHLSNLELKERPIQEKSL